ncbi:arylamine N-acetyltransferase [Brevibacillus fluminis]|uniref:Arylamine N-acetyltransferase n=1 Tax=Brevibacillus fluminis TaxID=511487 RepID=A0A3M8DFT2_9BACL|nr:arylamine N-acetyltransferase [Brevibacillus fluminis]RNB86894.1 arylamine N-acetyltransferase [Brevibacillus fluminis]
MYQMTKEERTAYLRRIGISDLHEPTKEYLFALHKAHVETLAWQCIDIFAGKPVGMDVEESIQLILDGRSGYCFHLNGAFSTLLRSLGYNVSMHRAGVQPLGAEPRINSFHLGLTVNLAGAHQEEDRWIVDVGLGDMPYEPLPLRFGTYEHAPLHYKVMESSVAANGWRLEHDPFATFTGVDFAPDVVESLEEFKPKHEYYSRHAESPWINLFLIRHRHATGSNELRGCVWSKYDKDGVHKTELQTKSQWLAVLGDVFGEHLVAYSDLVKDELWKRVSRAHEEWKKSKAQKA